MAKIVEEYKCFLPLINYIMGKKLELVEQITQCKYKKTQKESQIFLHAILKKEKMK